MPHRNYMIAGIILLVLSWLPLLYYVFMGTYIHNIGLGMRGFTGSVFAFCLMGLSLVFDREEVEWDPL